MARRRQHLRSLHTRGMLELPQTCRICVRLNASRSSSDEGKRRLGEIPGYRKHYEFLCEYAHPNWTGTHGAYAIIDKEAFAVTYEAVGRNPENTRKIIIGKLSGSVELFVGMNHFLGEKLGAFAEAVATFHAENGEPEH
jgi:hypothetical protein